MYDSNNFGSMFSHTYIVENACVKKWGEITFDVSISFKVSKKFKSVRLLNIPIWINLPKCQKSHLDLWLLINLSLNIYTSSFYALRYFKRRKLYEMSLIKSTLSFTIFKSIERISKLVFRLISSYPTNWTSNILI